MPKPRWIPCVLVGDWWRTMQLACRGFWHRQRRRRAGRLKSQSHRTRRTMQTSVLAKGKRRFLGCSYDCRANGIVARCVIQRPRHNTVEPPTLGRETFPERLGGGRSAAEEGKARLRWRWGRVPRLSDTAHRACARLGSGDVVGSRRPCEFATEAATGEAVRTFARASSKVDERCCGVDGCG